MICLPGGLKTARLTRWYVSFLLLQCLFFSQVYCGHDIYSPGARCAAMGCTGVVLPDLWAVHYNQAGLALLTRPAIGFHHENRFLVPELGQQSLALALPVRPGTIGLSVSYFGYAQYNESKIGLAFGKKLAKKLAAGIQIDYFNLFIGEGYGNQGTLSAELGILAIPNEKLFIGAHVYNPFLSGLETYPEERIPTLFRIGAGYLINQRILITTQLDKALELPPSYRAGLEYNAEKLFLRTGICSYPLTQSFGLGYRIGGIRGDVAFSSHQVLGLTPHFSLQVEF